MLWPFKPSKPSKIERNGEWFDVDPWGNVLGPPPPPKGGKARFSEIQGIVNKGKFKDWRGK